MSKSPAKSQTMPRATISNSSTCRNITEVPQLSHVERCDRSYVRVVHGEITSGGYQLSIHLASKDDTSPAHRTYDSRCGWCWLGANHSELAHQASLPAPEYPVEDITSIS